MNGGAQLGAVTWPYNRQRRGAEVLSPALRTCAKGGHHLGGLGYAPPENFWILDFLKWFLMQFLNKKKSLPISNQNNVELFLKISYCKRNLSRQFPKDPKAGVTCVPHIYTSLLLVRLAQPRDGAAV